MLTRFNRTDDLITDSRSSVLVFHKEIETAGDSEQHTVIRNVVNQIFSARAVIMIYGRILLFVLFFSGNNL